MYTCGVGNIGHASGPWVCSKRFPVFQAKFGTQANALFRKNVVYQLRNKKTTCCALIAPIFFCLILLFIQLAVNNALSTDDLKVLPSP
jgi:hypothetical protein